MGIFDTKYELVKQKKGEISEKKEQGTSYTGVYISTHTRDLMNLFLLTNGKSRTWLIRQALLGYLSRVIVCPADLYKDAAAQIRKQWIEIQWADKNSSFGDYILTVRDELIAKKINPEHIEEIIKRVKP